MVKRLTAWFFYFCIVREWYIAACNPPRQPTAANTTSTAAAITRTIATEQAIAAAADGRAGHWRTEAFQFERRSTYATTQPADTSGTTLGGRRSSASQ